MSAFDRLSAWIEGQMAVRGWPGLSIGVVRDQQLVWARGFGWADVERRVAATPGTRYRVASITKTFTATAILQLRDAGKLRLDDEVRAHLPWFTPATPFADAPPITIRHLITHTAGLPREAPFPYWTDGAFPPLAQIRAAIATQASVLPTETRWKYSNLALVVAGEVVAAASGESWGAYLTRHVLEPLGMRDTRVDTPAPDDPRLARPYGRRLASGERLAAHASDVAGVSAAAGLTTTVEDLARFVMQQLRTGAGGGILRPSTLLEMQRIHWLEPEWQAGWGLGFHIVRVGRRTLVGHAGVLRGYRSDYRFAPAEKLGVIVLINGDDGEPRLVVDKAFEWLAPELAPAAPPAATPDPAWQRYVGRYRGPMRDTEVLLDGDRLLMIQPALPDPMPLASTLVPAGEHTFRIETSDGFGNHGETAVFELDAGGRVTRLRTGPNYAERVSDW
ncbi:MAG: serine hydrolase [Candidatus Rokubacteria bacterium]|nr:serine hydrolase [Candidatus Rokubacteria bacterium]